MLHLLPALILETLDAHMVEIEGGTFEMGGKSWLYDAEPIHETRLQAFTLCRFLVTQQLYEDVIGQNPSYFLGSQRPVESIMWYDAIEFCNQLSVQQGLAPCYQIDKEQADPHNKSNSDSLKWTISLNPQANGFRLPTEAEWEYAARGGRHSNGSTYAGSHFLEEVGWYKFNSAGETQPIGQRRPNELGLYDLSGNIWECCWDWYSKDSYESNHESNPQGPPNGASRVVRGGSRNDYADSCRVAYRYGVDPSRKNYDLGFRLARTLCGRPPDLAGSPPRWPALT